MASVIGSNASAGPFVPSFAVLATLLAVLLVVSLSGFPRKTRSYT